MQRRNINLIKTYVTSNVNQPGRKSDLHFIWEEQIELKEIIYVQVQTISKVNCCFSLRIYQRSIKSKTCLETLFYLMWNIPSLLEFVSFCTFWSRPYLSLEQWCTSFSPNFRKVLKAGIRVGIWVEVRVQDTIRLGLGLGLVGLKCIFSKFFSLNKLINH